MSTEAKTIRTPKQTRAKITVERILQSAAELIQVEGIEGLTTNKVADAAHINIATLYQYFPNKQAIIEALIEQYSLQITKVLSEMMDSMMDLSIEEACKTWLNTALSLHMQSGNVILEIIEYMKINTLFSSTSATQLENTLMESGRKFLMNKRNEINTDNLNASIYVAFNTALSVVSKHILNPTNYLSDKEVVDEVSKMISKYFKP